MTGTRVGWIGTGVMGAPMCGHLLASGYPVTVFNRTPERARGLLERGAAWAESPQAVAQHADVVFTMVGFPDDVREIVLGPAGTLAGAGHGTILVDMTTSEPSLAREIYEAARARGVASLDAPVSGGDVGARAAGLALVEQLYLALVAQGDGRKGTHALVLALARLSAVEWPATPSAPPPPR